MKRLLLSLWALGMAFSLTAQPDSLMQQIMNRPAPSTLIANGRQMFLDELLGGNIEKSATVRNYLCYQVGNTKYLAFTNIEYFLSLFWTRDYDELIVNAMVADSLLRQTLPSTTIMPPRDELARVLPEFTADSLSMLEGQLDAAVLDPMERDFLKIFLKWLVVTDYDYAQRREIRIQATRYLSDYPYTPYKDFVNKYLVFKIEVSDWGGGVSMGAGVAIPGGDLPELCNVGANISFVLDAMYRDLYMGFGANISGGGTLKRDIAFRNYNFTTRDSWTEIVLNLRTGYSVVNTNRIALVPYVHGGVGWFQLTWTDKNNTNNSVSRTSTAKMVYGAGAYCDIKFSDSHPVYKITGQKLVYSSLRLRYHVGFADYSIPNAERCAIHTISVEWGAFVRNYQRTGR